MQQIMIIGNLGEDCQVQNVNGNMFLSFRVACTEKFNKNGQPQETTVWYSCAYSNADSRIRDFLKKGTKVFVQGFPQYRLYDSQKYRCKMIDVQISVRIVELCGGKQLEEANQAPQAGQGTEPKNKSGAKGNAKGNSEEPSDLPF